jgi:mannose-6-phosphate isomerase
MIKIYKLINQIKHYEWGSAEMLPGFLGLENRKNLPWAEMWMGTHSSAPSRLQINEMGESVNLEEFTNGELPYLFKLLAVDKPLSIQAHPNKVYAQKGFKRENEAGLNQKSPVRNYKDPNHKPEMLCAITPFTLMAGFRESERIHASFVDFISIAPQMGEAFAPLLHHLEENSLGSFFVNLFNLSKYDRDMLCSLLLEKIEYRTDNEMGLSQVQWELMKVFASQYPGDAAILSPLYLNLLTLQPGQAIFVPSGVLHSYISGFATELMTNSDNVLRGGLTPKYVDIGELSNILDFTPLLPAVYSPCSDSLASSGMFRYPIPCDEFSFSLLRGSEKEICMPFNKDISGISAVSCPSICIITEGELQAGGLHIKKGESFFVPQGTEQLLLKGSFSLFMASR